MIEIKINGLNRQVKKGLTIMQACESYNITIPHFCYHDKLSIAGNCRMCLVEVIENPNNPLVKKVASCARNVSPGMEVYTNTALVNSAREGVLEFLLANHPLDCPICDQGGECDLQDQAIVFGSDRGRFYESKRAVENKDCGPLIKTIMTRCIHCTRCIRFISEVAGVPMMGTTGRGSTMEVGFYIEKVLASEVSGNIIDLCPVGALTSKPYSFTARPWELKSYNSIDLFDAIGSNIRVDVRGSNIMRILPRINASLNEDWISDKVRFAYDGLKAQRLLSPFAKVDGSLVKVSWQKAFYFIRHFFFTALDTKHSSKFRTQGIVGNFIDAEAMVAFKDLFNRLGSSNYTFAQDNSCYDNTFRQSYLFNTPISQVESADVCLLIATNPRLEAPTLNIKLRKLFLSNVSIYNLGFYSTLNYYTKHLGNNLNVLIKVLEGNHWFCQKLLLAQNPLVIIGSSFFQRMDNLYKLLPLLQRLLLNNSSIRASGNSNFFNINHLPWASNTVTALDLNLKSSNYFRTKLPADFIYLLGADDIASPILKSTGGLCVYQGHHGDQSVSKADIILPSITYFEKDSTYSSIEGSPLQTKAIFYNLGKARNDWKILRALAEVLDVSLVFSSKKELHQRLVNLIPYYKHNWVANTHFDYLVKKLFSKNSVVASYCTTPFASYVNNFYLNDSISRASKTMSLCSSSYNLRGRFF